MGVINYPSDWDANMLTRLFSYDIYEFIKYRNHLHTIKVKFWHRAPSLS